MSKKDVLLFRGLIHFEVKNFNQSFSENKFKKKEVIKNKILLYFQYLFFQKKISIFGVSLTENFKNILFSLKGTIFVKMKSSSHLTIHLNNKRMGKKNSIRFFQQHIKSNGFDEKNKKLKFEKRKKFFSFFFFLN